MPTPRLAWTFDTLGPPLLRGPAGPARVDRRGAVLLAYLGLEGAQPRARLATLLWPDVSDATGRANLRQLVRRLGDATSGEVLEPGDPLALRPALTLDVARLRQASTAELAAAGGGRFLEGVDLDPVHEDLREWAERTRASIDRQRTEACLAEAGGREAAGELDAALELVHRALWIDPTLESAYRMLMRLHYQAGDRSAAIAAFSRCRVALREQLGIEPAPETAALADEIRRARRHEALARALPLSVLRPPRLFGRDREWRAMQEAWAEGRGIVIAGPPGIGKSRLAQEFTAAHGRALWFRARPGDLSVPYGTHARTYRELVEHIGGADMLPPWVRRELARIVPTLGDPPPALAGEEDRLRFWSAKVEAHRIAYAHGYDILGFDDLQLVDSASAAAGEYVLQQLGADSATPVRTLHCYRVGEIRPELAAMLRELAAAGAILHLELEPLDDHAVLEIMRSLEVPGLEAMAPALARYGGGVPLFVLEACKHLVETGALEAPFPAALPPPGKAGDVLSARLARLSAPALAIARVLALTEDGFSLALAASVADLDGASVAEAWAELDTARIVRGLEFSHDLLCEAVLHGIPAAVRADLHRRLATAMEREAAAPGYVAAQWLAAGDAENAARSRRAAEEDARRTMLEGEAARYFHAADARPRQRAH